MLKFWAIVLDICSNRQSLSELLGETPMIGSQLKLPELGPATGDIPWLRWRPPVAGSSGATA